MSADVPRSDPNAPIVGIDVGGTTTRVGLVDTAGTIIALRSSSTPHGADALAAHLIEEIGGLIDDHGAAVAAIGLGVPGRIDPAGRSLSMAVNLGIDQPTPIADRLETTHGVPVTLGNDVDFASLGAYEQLAGGTGSLGYLSLGTGLAVGLILDGRLHRGFGGAGEIGHLPVPGGDITCGCGQVGCAETMASGAWMLRAWGHPDLGIEALWDAADAGDRAADHVRQRAVAAIEWVVQCITLLLDVENVVIGGGVSRLGDRLLGPIAEVQRERAAASPLVASYDVANRLRMTPVGTEYGVIGAAGAARLTATEPPVTSTSGGHR